MSRRGVFDQAPKAQIRIIGAKVKRTKVETMVTTTATTTSKGVTMVIETTGVDPMFLLKIVKLLLGMVEIVWHELRICCTK